MDTSDSECFESADEEIDDEPPSVIKVEAKKEVPEKVSRNLEKNEQNTVKEFVKKHDKCEGNEVENKETQEILVSKSEDNEVKCRVFELISVQDHSNELKLPSNENISNIDKPCNDPVNSEVEVNDSEVLPKLSELSIETSSNNCPFPSKEEIIEEENVSDLKQNEIEKVECTEKDFNFTVIEKEDANQIDSSDSDPWKIDDWDNVDDESSSNNKLEQKTTVSCKNDKKSVKNEDESNFFEDDWDQWESFSNECDNSVNKPEKPDDNKLLTNKNDVGWDSWTKWGVSSLLSTATSSVSNITNQVTHSINTVLENGMGIPDPEELARLDKEEQNQVTDNLRDNVTDVNTNEDQARGFNFKHLLTGVSHITKLVESTGTKVITGGLDTLETIGKKTVEVLQEGDPGLKKKRAFLRLDSDKPNLSQVLKEAKERSQEENVKRKNVSKKVNYETLFDDHHGLVHLEALEMLSKQCNIKLSSMFDSCENPQELQETVEQIRELCEYPEDDNDEKIDLDEMKTKINEYISEMNIRISYDKLFSVWEECKNWLESSSEKRFEDVYGKAIDTLAQLTAIAVEQFHKSAELLLTKHHRSTADEADSLVQITSILVIFMGFVALQFCEKLSHFDQDSESKALITNVYFEAANSCSYIKDAFKLLIPVIEVGAI